MPAEPETTKSETTSPEAAAGESEPQTTEPDSGAEPAAGVGEPAGDGVSAATGEGAAGESKIEVFYTFKLRPRQRPAPGPGRRRDRGEGDGQQGAGKHDSSKHGGPGRAKGGTKGKGARHDRDDAARKPKPDRPRRLDKPVDPLSPFAILAQLKDK